MARFILMMAALICVSMFAAPLAHQPAMAEMERLFPNTKDTGPCRLDVRIPGGIHFRGLHSRGYVASDAYMHEEYVQFEILHSGEACAYVVRIEPKTGGTPRMTSQSDLLEYRIAGGYGPSNANGEGAGTSGYFGNGKGSATADFSIEVPTGQNVQAGRFKDEIVISVYNDTDGMMELVSARSIHILTKVQPSVTASLGSEATAGMNATSVEFGQLHQGKTRNVDFAVNANTGYEISLESDNGGALKHFASEAEVAYAVRLDGVQLSSEDLVSGGSAIRGSASSVHDLQIEIVDNTALAVAGRYEDRLTIVITAD